MTAPEPKRRDRTETLGCLAILALWVVLGLHFFADRIWDKEPPVLKWVVIGYGCLVLLGLVGTVVFGKRGDKVGALILLAIIALAVAFLRPRPDPQAAADVDEMVRELAERGEAVERQADALPAITDETTRAELDRYLNRSMDEVREQATASEAIPVRAEELFLRAPKDKREQLTRAIREYYERSRRASEKRDRWMQAARARVEALKKEQGGPK
jgi:hypothetical protein